MTLTALAASWLGLKMAQAAKQGRVVAKLMERKASVSYAYPKPCDVEPPLWMRKFLGEDLFRNVEGVTAADLTDCDMKLLEELPQVKYLYLAGSNISDTGLESVTHCGQIEELSLDNTKVGDDGMESIAHLKHLRALFIPWTGISDLGLRHFKQLTELEVLDLRGTEITDAALVSLSSKSRLRAVLLDSSALESGRITESAIQEVAMAVPEVRFKIYNGPKEMDYEDWKDDRSRQNK